MKKLLLSLFAFAACTGITQAQEPKYYSFGGCTMIDDYGDYEEEYFPLGWFYHVSGNGKYAVGYDTGAIVTSTGGAYLWVKDDPSNLVQLSDASKSYFSMRRIK